MNSAKNAANVRYKNTANPGAGVYTPGHFSKGGCMKRISLVISLIILTFSVGANLAFGQSLEVKGIELCNDGKFDQAIATFTEGLKQKPNDPNLLFLRGKAYTAKGQYAPALADLNQAIQQKPGFGQAYFGRAMVHVYQENFDEALNDLQLAEKNGYKDSDFMILVKKKAENKKKK
jgi:tetratricopeptide (TPR) repeat protein